MTTRDFLAHIFGQTDCYQVAANLTGRIIEKSQRKDFEIVKSFAHFIVYAFTQLLYIHACVLQRDTYKRPFAIFLLISIMHSRTYCCFKHDTSARWYVDFPTIDGQVGVAISPSQTINCPADLITGYENQKRRRILACDLAERSGGLALFERRLRVYIRSA